MSGFRLTGGSSRGGKMAEAAGQMMAHTWTRREAALRAAVAHLGITIKEMWRDGAQRSRIVVVFRERAAHPLGDAWRFDGSEESVELDGVPVWRGGWRWEGYTATWHEEPLTEWMAAALATGPEVVT